MIPRQIYQTFSSERELPDWYFPNRDGILSKNPGWSYKIFFNDECEEFIIEYYGARILDAYRRIDPRYGAARADLFRYLLIYAHGGVYLDLKSSITRPLDEVFHGNEHFILSNWDKKHFYNGWGKNPEVFPRFPNGEICQWFIISQAGHPYLRSVIDQCIYNIHHYKYDVDGFGQRGVLRTTGPVPFTLGIEKARGIAPHEERNFADLGLVYSIFEAQDPSGSSTSSVTHMTKDNYRNHRFPVVRTDDPEIDQPDEARSQRHFLVHEARRYRERRLQLLLRPRTGIRELRLYLGGRYPRFMSWLDPRRNLP